MSAWLDDGDVQLFHGDAQLVLDALPAGAAQTCVTSPPYWALRDYGVDGQIGDESTPDEYAERLVAVFRSVRRVLRDDGTLWLNLGDSYASGGGESEHRLRTSAASTRGGGHSASAERRVSTPRGGLKPKDLAGVPWRVALALQADGWYLRSDVVWSKPNPMPDSATDRPARSHEYVFLLSKSARYVYDADDALRTVWKISAQPLAEAHFATFPEELARRCIVAGSRAADLVLDPFVGSGTTALVARKQGRRAIGIDLHPGYLRIAERRLQQLSLFSGGLA